MMPEICAVKNHDKNLKNAVRLSLKNVNLQCFDTKPIILRLQSLQGQLSVLRVFSFL